MHDNGKRIIQQIRERLSKLVPNWYKETGYDHRVYANAAWGVCKPTNPKEYQRIADAEFIANAPADMQFLLDEIDRLQKAHDQLLEDVQPFARACKNLASAPFADKVPNARLYWFDESPRTDSQLTFGDIRKLAQHARSPKERREAVRLDRATADCVKCFNTRRWRLFR